MIDPAKLIFLDAPPMPGHKATLALAISLQWVSIFFACLAMNAPNAALVGSLLVAFFFTAQLVTGWRLLTMIGEPAGWARLNATERRPLWYAAFGALAIGTAGVVGTFLFWMLG